MPTPIITVQVNGGAPQTGPVTVANGDTIQLGCSNGAFFQSFAWRIFSHYGMSVPAGWSTEGDWYTDTGAAPSSFTIPASTWWGKLLIKLVCDGDEPNKSATIGLSLDSANGLKDVVLSITADGVETGETNEFHAQGSAVDLQATLREVDDFMTSGGGGGGGGDPRVILWDPDNSSPDATKGEAETWADVEALVTSGPAIVYVLPGTSATYDVDGTFDGQDSTLCSTSGSPEINVVDGEAIQNMRLEGITLRGNNTTASTGCWTSSQTEWHAKRVAFVNDGSAPIVWTRFGTLYLDGGCAFDDTSASEVLELDTSAAIVSLRITGGFELGADTVKGVGSSSLIFRHDGTITTLAAQANFAGDAYNCPLGTNGGAGPHSFRPRAITGYDLPDGCTYRHTGLGSTVTWNATGARWEVTSGDGAFPSIARYLRGAIAGAAGSYTTGNSFKTNRERYITGVRFIWVTAGGSAENVKVSIWKGGSSVHSQTFSISAGTTFNELSFTSAYHVAGGDERTEFHITTWETSGSRYCKQYTVGPPAWHAGAIPVGDHEWTACNKYAAGDANPASTAGSETYSVEPIYGMEA